MFDNDVHAPGSVDRELVLRMVLVCPETKEHLYSDFTPMTTEYRVGSIPKLEGYLGDILKDCGTKEVQVEAIVRYCCEIGVKADAADPKGEDWQAMRFGGLEEEIIERTSDWCADLARVAVALCQVAGIPARLVQLCNVDHAYSGHVVAEVGRDGVWGVVDPLRGTVYVDAGGKPMTAWDVISNSKAAMKKDVLSGVANTSIEEFNAVAISNYFVWDRNRFVYTVSSITKDSYNYDILVMSAKGWPGGLRWLHGEDQVGI